MPYKTFTDKQGKTHRWFSKPHWGREGHKQLGRRVGTYLRDIQQQLSDQFEIPPERIQLRVKGIRIIKPETLDKMRARGRKLYETYGPKGRNVLKNYRTMKMEGKLTPSFTAQNAKKAGQMRSIKAFNRASTWNEFEAGKLIRNAHRREANPYKTTRTRKTPLPPRGFGPSMEDSRRVNAERGSANIKSRAYEMSDLLGYNNRTFKKEPSKLAYVYAPPPALYPGWTSSRKRRADEVLTPNDASLMNEVYE